MSLQAEIAKFHGVSIPNVDNMPFGCFEQKTQAQFERENINLLPGTPATVGPWEFRLARSTGTVTEGCLMAAEQRINYVSTDTNTFATTVKGKLTGIDEDNAEAMVANELAGGVILPNPATPEMHYIKGNTAAVQDATFNVTMTPDLRTATSAVPPLIARSPYYETAKSDTDTGIEMYLGCAMVDIVADTSGVWYWIMTKGPGIGYIAAVACNVGNVLTACATAGGLTPLAISGDADYAVQQVAIALDITDYSSDALVTHIPVWWTCP